MSAPRRVLIVDDDVVVARAIARVLEQRGMSTYVALSRADAEAAGGDFDAGIFDIDLPDGNGIELAGALLGSGAVGTAVFHSGESAVDTRLAASELGSFVSKGEGIHALHKVLIDALGEAQVVAQAVGAEGIDATPRRRGCSRSGKRRKLT